MSRDVTGVRRAPRGFVTERMVGPPSGRTGKDPVAPSSDGVLPRDRMPAHQAFDRSMAGEMPAFGVCLSTARRESRRENDEDQKAREEERRGRPRQNGDRAASVDFHGPLTRHNRVVLRLSR